MPKPQDIPACPSKPPVPRVNTHTYDIELITPMFGGGVETRVNDPSFPIRPTSIRGQLQFWWRATVGAQYRTIAETPRRPVGGLGRHHAGEPRASSRGGRAGPISPCNALIMNTSPKGKQTSTTRPCMERAVCQYLRRDTGVPSTSQSQSLMLCSHSRGRKPSESNLAASQKSSRLTTSQVRSSGSPSSATSVSTSLKRSSRHSGRG
ncbi:MAG: hypothetical protein KatS3mg104_1008 [Phycisphaerae bacterium]|nr:MAG: hypothetical protein KatS3mg104_1008 [Phycisphaerae bacterium]